MARATGLDGSAGLRTTRRRSPAVAAQPAQSAGLQVVMIEEIAPNPRNPKARMSSDLEELAASIASKGILQPLLLTSVREWVDAYPEDADAVAGKAWVVQDGHRRFAAAQMAGSTQVPFVPRGADVDETVLRIATSYHSRQLTPIEEALSFQILIEQRGLTQQEIAAETGVSQGHISKRLKLLSLPISVQDAVDQGMVAASAALRLGKTVDSDLAERVGSRIASSMEPTSDSPDDLDTAPPSPIDVDQLISIAAEERRQEEASETAARIAKSLGGEYVEHINDRIVGSAHTHKLTDPAAIQQAAADNNLLVAPGTLGTEPDYYAATAGPAVTAAQRNEHERRHRDEAAQARVIALGRAADRPIPTAVLRDTLVMATLAGLGLSTPGATRLSYRLACSAELASPGWGDWTWRTSLLNAESSLRPRIAWITAISAIEATTALDRAPWGELQRWYFATLKTLAAYTPTEWEAERLNSIGKDTSES